MAELKTQRTGASVDEYLAGVADARRRADAQEACALMADVTGAEPQMWGPSIVGFGVYHYEGPRGQVNEWPAVGLSPRKQSLTLYLMSGFDGYDDLLGRLGRHSVGKGCLYLPRLSDVDKDVLRDIVRRSFTHTNGRRLTRD